MKQDNQKKEFKFDASEYVSGRLAVEIAEVLQGKNDVSYEFNKCPNVRVVVINSNKIKATGKKMTDKVYKRHTGYSGPRGCLCLMRR